MRLSTLFCLSLSAFTLFGCANTDFREVPPGYIAKVLTPNGYSSDILEAGQVNIGSGNIDGSYNTLVLCEATSTTVKESFGGATEEDAEDHRIITRDGVPLTVDVRIQVMIPKDQKERDSIFAQITPSPVKDSDRTRIIELNDIYSQFATGPIRNRVRTIFMEYPSYQSVITHYGEINNKISRMVAKAFDETHVPLLLLSGELSNVKADEKVLDAQNRNAAAIAQVAQIEKIGRALKNNPQYLKKYEWDVIAEAARKGATIIIDAGSKPLTLPVK